MFNAEKVRKELYLNQKKFLLARNARQLEAAKRRANSPSTTN